MIVIIVYLRDKDIKVSDNDKNDNKIINTFGHLMKNDT